MEIALLEGKVHLIRLHRWLKRGYRTEEASDIVDLNAPSQLRSSGPIS